MIICVCKCISDSQIKSAIEAGVTTVEGLQCALGVGSQCGSCSCEVTEILQQTHQSMKKQSKFVTPAKQVQMPVFAAEIEASNMPIEIGTSLSD